MSRRTAGSCRPPLRLSTLRRLRWAYVPHVPGAPALELTDVSVCYDGRPAVEGLTFSLAGGDQLAVVGPNGAGKSTLLRVVAGILPPTEGRVLVHGQGPSGHVCIAYLPQRAEVDWRFPVSVLDVVMMGRVGKLGLFRRPGARDWALARSALAAVGLSELAGRRIGELSGGQAQRMFIARALAQEAELALMDEPLAGLDPRSQEEVLDLLGELGRREVTVMLALHDLDVAAGRFAKVLLLNRRIIGLGPPGEVFTPDRLKQAFGGRLQSLAAAGGPFVVSDPCGSQEGLSQRG
ncbi:MAG: metal ABC transporter ATP-binding protein [Candidatus Bipolaricaulaceae bacterium]